MQQGLDSAHSSSELPHPRVSAVPACLQLPLKPAEGRHVAPSGLEPADGAEMMAASGEAGVAMGISPWLRWRWGLS